MNILLWVSTAVCLLISALKDKKKTIHSLKKAFHKLSAVLLLFLLVMAAFAFVITFVPAELIQNNIGKESGIKGILLSLGVGSMAVMPGFAAYPLCAALKSEGIPYYIIAAFSLSLMNVGFATFPIEKNFLGFSTALIRNIIALGITIIVTLIVKVVFGE